MKKIIILFFIGMHSLQSQNFITSEQFASCSLPDQWKSQITTGNFGFSIMKSSLLPQSDPTCSILYNQTDKNDNTAKNFSILSKEFNLFSYNQYNLNFGLRFIKTNANSTLKLFSIIDGTKSLIQNYTSDVLQNGIVLVIQNFTLQANEKNRRIQFLFEYAADGADYNSLILIDNLNLYGPDNDDCSRAVSLQMDQDCLSGNNTGAFFTGPPVKCPGNYAQSLWYKFNSNYTGYVKLNTRAEFNDAVSIFEGSCPSLNDIACLNNDEYGFEGEQSFLQVESGKNYFIRITKQFGYYGRDDANNVCIGIEKMDPAPPKHDHCSNSIVLQVNSNCLSEVNLTADFSAPVPSLNAKSRADVWYRFKPTSTQALEIKSQADFADVLTVYKGNCNQLEEVQCEDLGGTLLLANPVTNSDYFIQVSGYFSTIEGHLCLEVKTKSTIKPVNDDCPTAKAINLNETCQQNSTINSSKSTVKPSCVVYSASDVWYSFIAPAEKNIAITVESGFLYNWAVYSGKCSSLREIACGVTPDPCSDQIVLQGLQAGDVYYLQIIADVNPLRPSEGSLCVKIEELSRYTPITPVKLQLLYECLHGVLGKVNYQVEGGTSPYLYEGPSPNEIYFPGTVVEAFAEDANGCRDFDKLTIDCTPPSKCNSSSLDLEVTTECIFDQIGRQTGEVILRFNGKGGSGAYYFYGTPDGAKLKHGDEYQIVIIDTDSCYLIEEGRINCPPFDCSQSQLSIISNYICVDTLFKAILQIDVKGNLGNFVLSGNRNGDLLEQGQHYETQVIDEAGCVSIASGDVVCKFDSCAYSRPALRVDYTCLLDVNGNQTGRAILNVQASSYAGGIVIQGNKNGDTLNHLDYFSVHMLDAFGCAANQSGEINCIITDENSPATDLISFYPNPANDFLYIKLPDTNDPELKFSIHSASGILLDKFTRNTNSKENLKSISIDNYPSGLLYIKIEGKTFFDIIRFIKI